MAAGIAGLFFYILDVIWNLIVGVFRRIYCWILYRYFLFNYDKRVDVYRRELFFDLEDRKQNTELYPITPVVRQNARNQQQCGQNAKFTILEIGVGWGVNFRYFPKGSSVVVIEPTFPKERFQEYLEMIHSHDFGVQISKVVATDPEDLSHVDTESVDATVCTRVLCKVRDVDKVLSEIRRVLKPGGRFYFMEHVFTPERSFTHYMQRLLNPLQVKFGDNCHFTRETWKNIERAGFSEVQYKRFNAFKLPFIIRPHLMGTATKY